MTDWLSIVLLGSLTSAAAQPQPATQGEPTIVVTGERITDLRAALAACLARNCPPNEDVDASLALAEGEFLNGDYEDAEATIRASVERNQRQAKGFPEPVADLWRSQARVQSHRGRDQQALRSTRNILNALQTGIPQEDHRHFTARFELIDAMLRTGDGRGARRQLDGIVEAARSTGRTDVARMAEMQILRIDYLIQPGHEGPALRRLERLAASTDPRQLFESVAARLFLARVCRKRGDITRSDSLLSNIPRADTDRRQLLYSPPYRLTEEEPANPSGSTTRRLPDNYHNSWIDVGYWIDPAGSVTGLEVVRQGARPDWAQPLLESIRGRRYSPSTDGTPSYRLERYTYTAPFVTVTGSRIQTRSRRARVEFLDLTTANETGRAPDSTVQPETR